MNAIKQQALNQRALEESANLFGTTKTGPADVLKAPVTAAERFIGTQEKPKSRRLIY